MLLAWPTIIDWLNIHTIFTRQEPRREWAPFVCVRVRKMLFFRWTAVSIFGICIIVVLRMFFFARLRWFHRRFRELTHRHYSGAWRDAHTKITSAWWRKIYQWVLLVMVVIKCHYQVAFTPFTSRFFVLLLPQRMKTHCCSKQRECFLIYSQCNKRRRRMSSRGLVSL